MQAFNGGGLDRTMDLQSTIRRHPLAALGIGFLAGFDLGNRPRLARV